MTPLPWKCVSDGLELHIKATPKASSAGVVGIEVDAAGMVYLKVKITALPEDGAANHAIQKLLGKILKIAPSTISLKSGGAARYKTFVIEGNSATLFQTCMDLWGTS